MERKINPMARRTLEQLLMETGHSLGLDDVPAINRLNDLACAITQPQDDDERQILALPAVVGRVCLRQPSIGKLKWFEECPMQWWPRDSEMLDAALGYACSVDNTESALHELADSGSAKKAVMQWWRRARFTPEDFAIALQRVLPTPEGSDGPNQYGPLLGLLVREYGNSVDYWMWQAPWSLVKAMLADYNARTEQAYKAYQKMQQRGKGKGGQVAPPATPRMYAQRRYRLYVAALRNRWLKQQEAAA